MLLRTFSRSSYGGSILLALRAPGLHSVISLPADCELPPARQIELGRCLMGQLTRSSSI